MSDEPQDIAIALVGGECKSLFDQHLSQYGNEVPLARRSVKEYHQRYDAWLAFLGVVSKGRLSLDHRLRHSLEVRSLVLQQLHVLKRNLEAAIGLQKSNASQNGSGKHIMGKDDEHILSPALEACLRGTQGALDQLHRLGRSIRQASAGQLMTRARRVAKDGRIGSFERMAHTVLTSYYPNANPQLLEQISTSLSAKYQEVIYRKGRDKEYRGVPWRTDEEARAARIPQRQPEEGAKTETASTSLPDVPAKPKAVTNESKAGLSGTQSSIFSERKFKKNYRPTSEKPNNTSSLHLGFASCPPPPKIPKDADYAYCNWCLEHHPVTMFKTTRNWRNHIEKDWRPYVCLSEECRNMNPLPSFDTVRLWETHMRESHSENWSQRICKQPTWICDTDHPETLRFPTEAALVRHLKGKHRDLSLPELQTIAQQSLVSLTRAKDICPLCCFLIERDATASNKAAGVDAGQQYSAKSASTKGRGKSVKFAGVDDDSDCSDEQESRTRSAETPVPRQPPSTLQTGMVKEVAGHLQTVTFLIVRLLSLPENPDEDDDDNPSVRSDQFVEDKSNASKVAESDYQNLLTSDWDFGGDMEERSDVSTEESEELDGGKNRLRNPNSSGNIYPDTQTDAKVSRDDISDDLNDESVHSTSDDDDMNTEMKDNKDEDTDYRPSKRTKSSSSRRTSRTSNGESSPRLNGPHSSITASTHTSVDLSKTSMIANLDKYCCSRCPQSYVSLSRLNKHIRSTHTRPLTCTFARYGCSSTFGSKNEWKRHSTSQHIRPDVWRCDIDNCVLKVAGKESWNEFNRKDLFRQHVRRMHGPAATASKIEKEKFETSLKEIEKRCWRQLHPLPPKSLCGFCVHAEHRQQKTHSSVQLDDLSSDEKEKKSHVFEGKSAWDERMEHVSRHLEKQSMEEEEEDLELRNWMVSEGLLFWENSAWRVVGIAEGKKRGARMVKTKESVDRVENAESENE